MTDTGVALGNQRHILQLQAADRLLGDVLDGLEDEGRFDDAMIVVTADHGNAFISGEPERALAEGNMEQIMWTPLLIKEPAQTTPVVDDSPPRPHVVRPEARVFDGTLVYDRVEGSLFTG